MTTKWKSAKRSAQLAWHVAPHCTHLQCLSFDGQEGPGQNAYALNLFLEGHLMAGDAQILCPAGGGPAQGCRDADVLLGLGSQRFVWEHVDWVYATEKRETCLTQLPFLLPAFCPPLNGVEHWASGWDRNTIDILRTNKSPISRTPGPFLEEA